MKRLNVWALPAIVAALISVTTQQTLPKPAPPPANSTDTPTEKAAFFVKPSSTGPVYISTAYFRPAHELVTAGKIITSPPYPVNQQPTFQTPESLSTSSFQGHASYLQKVLFQSIPKPLPQQQQVQQQLQQQQQLLQQRVQQQQLLHQAQLYFQQMHPFLRQQFVKLSPATQYQMFQQYLRYRKFLQEQADKALSNKRKQQSFVPQARERSQEFSITEPSN